MEQNKPIFEILTENEHIKIYENGKVEGFEHKNKCMVLNRIPLHILELEDGR